MPQTSVLSAQGSAGGQARLRNRLVDARSSVYRREIVQALKASRGYRGFLMLAAIAICPPGDAWRGPTLRFWKV
jgi:hypothetical protein